MADEKKTTRVWLQTKHGRKMWRFGKHIGPDEATPMDVTPAQLADLRPQCVALAQGGVFNIFTSDPGLARPSSGGGAGGAGAAGGGPRGGAAK